MRAMHPGKRGVKRLAIGVIGAATLVAAGQLTALVRAEAVTWTDVGADAFSRSVNGSWGSADKGGAWALSLPSGATAQADGYAGVFRGLKAGTRASATLSVSAGDVRVKDMGTVETAGSYDVFHGTTVRRAGNGSGYAFRVRYNSAGDATIAVSRVSGNTSTWLAGANLPRIPRGTNVFTEVEVTGTSPVVLKARAYASTASAPGWQLQYSDSSGARIQSAGAVSLWDYVEKADRPLVVKRDKVAVAGGSGSTAPAPTPTSSPTQSPSPTPVPATGGRGSTVGSASFPVPAGAVFVSPGGSDSAAGSQGSPLKTVARAVAKASSGSTIVLRAGTYHEQVTIPTNKKLSIQSYPKEAVWFDGSKVVSNWTRSGSTWVATGWTASFSSSTSNGGGYDQSMVNAENPMAGHPDMVFVNGAPLRQVSAASKVTSGTFFVDYGSDKLVIGSDPSGKEVRASDLEQAIKVSSQNVTLQGFGVRRYATSYAARSAIKVETNGGVFRQLVVRDNAMIGMTMSAPDKTVENVTVINNGMLGLGFNLADRTVIKNSVVNDNNAERFNMFPVAGGVKLTKSRSVTVSNSEMRRNHGNGMWLDESSYDFRIVGSDMTDNAKVQLLAEISAKGVVANNTITGGEKGISIFNTSDVQIYNNHFGGHTQFGVKLAQDARRQSNGSLPGHDARRPVPDPTVTWVVKNITVANNVFGNGGVAQFYGLDGKSNIPVDAMNVTINGNLFNKSPRMVGWGGSDNRTVTWYDTPAALSSAKGRTWRNAQASSSMPVVSMSGEIAKAQSVAVSMPADVAAAAGVAAGLKKVGRW